MTERTRRKRPDTVSLWFTSEFISVKRNNEKIADILSNRFTVLSPERRHGVEKKGQGIHAKLPKLLILVPVAFFQGNNI